jgi:sulfatase maturation enzyme AslB (radical SAM superfamily)
VNALRTLELVLTSQCNLRCGYCFENDKKNGSMSWETARASLDTALASSQEEIGILFFGGEPALEFPTIRRSVEYVNARKRRSQRVRFRVITNGTLLGPEELFFLDEKRVHVQLSFDGVPEAQQLRGRGSFQVLEALLDTIRHEHPAMYSKRFSVSMTLLGRTIPFLADSVELFLGKQVREIMIGPQFTHDPTYRTEMIDDLRAQFRRVFRASVAHYARTGRVPVAVLRRGARSGPRPKRLTMCGVMRGEKLAVDVDGQSHGCVLFASSFQRFTTPFLKDRLESLALGDVKSGEPMRRLPMYEDAVRRTEIFHDKQDKYSSYAKCGACRYFTSCSVCPVSIGHQRGTEDPRRVPDLQCAFHLVALSYQSRFPTRRPGERASRATSLSDLARVWS